MTEQEIKEEAKKRYLEGTEIKGLADYSGKVSWVYTSFEPYYYSNSNKTAYIKISENHRAEIYNNGRWAEIISYPEGYNPTKDLLKELVIW